MCGIVLDDDSFGSRDYRIGKLDASLSCYASLECDFLNLNFSWLL